MRALIVDRRSTVEAELQRVLAKAGFRVFFCEDSGEALDFLQEHGAVELALVNWDLPEADGLRFALGLRSTRRFDITRLLMLSWQPSLGGILEAIQMGVDDCLVKPFNPRKLIEKLHQLQLVNVRTGT